MENKDPVSICNAINPYLCMITTSVSTPAVRYVQRTNSGDEVCCLNKASLPSSWRGNSSGSNKSRPPKIAHYNEDGALVKPYNFMYQTNSAKSTGRC